MPRINENITVTNDTNIGRLNEQFHLLANYLYLDSEYYTIYKMSYLDNIDGVYPNGSIINDNFATKKTMIYNELIDIIKINFSQQNMQKYFGSNTDLDTSTLRTVYNNMSKYYLILFYKKIQKFINKPLIVDNDPILCIIAECMHIIRASVKKYARLRISPTTLSKFTKKSLDKRNAHKYGCKDALEEYEYCPSFSQLHNGYTDGNVKIHESKSCKAIIESSLKTNETFNKLSFMKIPVMLPKKSYSSQFYISNKNVRVKSKTRKIIKSNQKEYTDIM